MYVEKAFTILASYTMVSSSIFLLKIFVMFVLIISPLSSATCPRSNDHNDSSSFARFYAEKLFREMNLCSKLSVNKVESDPLGLDLPPGSIYEWEVKFPNQLLANDMSPTRALGPFAGYFTLPRSSLARMFYFFFPQFDSNYDRNDYPVILWLSGGPGCGCELAMFYENGPYKITKDLTLETNELGWDQISNIIFVDQPIGTGFSYTSDTSIIPHDQQGVSSDLYDFIQAFFKEHPNFVNNNFYIVGQSFAGHYIPVLASRIQEQNKAQKGTHINLKGIAIGNGLTNPGIQYPALADFALERGLINQAQYNELTNRFIPQCNKSVRECIANGGFDCGTAFTKCMTILNYIKRYNVDGFNEYNIRKKCCDDFSRMFTLLSKTDVKDALGVGNVQFVACSEEVFNSMSRDIMKNYDSPIPSLLEDGIKVLIYNGEDDLVCNWIGSLKWVEAMVWPGQKDFGNAPTLQFSVDGKEGGTIKSFGSLAFIKIYEAGHTAPTDQPNVALRMITSLMQGTLLK